jgi:diadenosine tetraphosphate (Ap4A) HIT family hydrolase
MNANCPLCTADGGDLIWKNDVLRVILANEPDYPGFCRVIWNAHVSEMTNLAIADRSTLMQTVMKVEQAIIEVMRPDKVNLAALGNMVPHLHWHVIPRYQQDKTFPGSVWSVTVRDPDAQHLASQFAKVPALKQKLIDVLGAQ